MDLSSEENQAPTITLENTPSTVAPDATEAFTAQLSDDQGTAALVVDWNSDVDGALSSASVDMSGLATLNWDGSAQSVGSHSITVTATDSCGQTDHGSAVN